MAKVRGQRTAESYISKDPVKRARSLANLKGSPENQAIEATTSFLKNPQNKDIRYFLAHHYILENEKPIVLENWQIKNILDPLYPGDGKRPFDIAIIGLPKKNGKSTLSAGIGVFEEYFSTALAPEVYSLAVDRDQAAIIFDKSRKAIQRNPELRKLAKVYRRVIETPFNGGIYRVLAADIDSAHGLNPSCILMDEMSLAKWDLWVALLTGMGQRAGTGQRPIAIITTTAGYDLTSPFYKMYQSAKDRKEPDTYMFWTTENLASWIKPKWLEKQRKRLQPALYQRFHENKWVQGASSFITFEDIRRCIDQSLMPQGEGKKELRYILACDLGLTRDRSVTSIVHKEENKIILDSMRVWQGSRGDPVLISDIEDDIERSCDNFDIAKIVVDPWQMKGSIQKFEKKRYPVQEFTFSSNSLAKLSSNLFYLVHNGLFRIWDDPDLIGELLSVQAVQKNYGVRIDHRAGQFSDRVISLGMAALECVQLKPKRKGRVYIIGE